MSKVKKIYNIMRYLLHSRQGLFITLAKTIKAEDVHLSTLASLNRFYGRVMDVQSFLNEMNGK